MPFLCFVGRYLKQQRKSIEGIITIITIIITIHSLDTDSLYFETAAMMSNEQIVL